MPEKESGQQYANHRLGFAKVVSILLAIGSFAVGIYAFILSDFNKDCTSIPFGAQSELQTVRCDDAPVIWMEEVAVCIIGATVVVSLFYFLVHVCRPQLSTNNCSRAIDFGYHFVFGISLYVSCIFLAYSAYQIEEEVCKKIESVEDCQLLLYKYIAAGLACGEAVAFHMISIMIFNSSGSNVESV